MDSAKLITEDLIRFQDSLPKSGDAELLLLKSHLLIEGILTTWISNHCEDSKALDNARLSFYQRVHLAKALRPGDGDWLWDSLLKLNSARNCLAHRLSKDQLEKKIDSFVTEFKSCHPIPEPEFDGMRAQGFTDLHTCCFVLFAVLSGLTHCHVADEGSANAEQGEDTKPDNVPS
ncbi:MAG: hypothetical protein MI807_03945 [Verrucomicrobiales bacterium]|nr:hypothetical protein [Verrucomicrobiales bacterium]